MPEEKMPTDEEQSEAPGPASKKPKKEKHDAALLAEAEALKQELAEQKDAYQRMLAEYANYKRRTEQEKEQIGEYAKCDILSKLLPTLDNFDRAAAVPPGEDYKTGMDMVRANLAKALEKMGLTEIDALHQPFDPELHHAVTREDAPADAGGDGEIEIVTEVFQKGYRVGDRILRPAMVKVAN